MIEWISQPWPWYVAGPLIVFVMFIMLWFGKQLGVSSSFRTACAMTGAGKYIPFFDLKWREQMWNIMFVVGIFLGGFIGGNLLSDGQPLEVAPQTLQDLSEVGISAPGHDLVPLEIFSWEQLFTLRTLVFLVIGGFLIGFGTRWAGGCTSGHAIMGLSNLQLPSLIAVIGFFIGGLLMTHVLFPFLLQL